MTSNTINNTKPKNGIQEKRIHNINKVTIATLTPGLFLHFLYTAIEKNIIINQITI